MIPQKSGVNLLVLYVSSDWSKQLLTNTSTSTSRQYVIICRLQSNHRCRLLDTNDVLNFLMSIKCLAQSEVLLMLAKADLVKIRHCE